jgi:hypothetical protein
MRTSLNRAIESAVTVVAFSCAGIAWAGEWQSVTPMPGAKHHAIGVLRAGALHVIGGPPWVNRGDADASAFTFAGTTWSSASPVDGEGPVLGLGGGIDNLDRIILFGGINSENGDIAAGKVYDPTQGAGASIADRHDNAPSQHFATARDGEGRLYSIGGGGGAQGTNSTFVERYSGTTNSWQTVAAIPAAVADACACYDGAGHVLVFGGFNANGLARTNDVWRFDVASGLWNNAAVPDMPVPLTNAAAVLGNDHRIYVIGGETGPVGTGTVVATTYVLNLLDNTWSAAPSMSVPRRDFAAVLGNDDFIYAFGGTSTGGIALASAERVFAPTCPTFLTQTAPSEPWLGQTISLSASVGGGTPIQFRWKHAGVPLNDGPSEGGGTLAGTLTPTLTITSIAPADAGAYTLEATNACGVAESPVITLAIRVPPAIPGHWTTTNLHPVWAKSSGAACVENGRQGGYAVKDVASYTNLQQPVLWEGTAASAANITPGGSVGGAVYDLEGDTAVGSWWWPFQCYSGGQWYTCYYWQASRWTGVGSGAGLVHSQLQVSGWDIGYARVVRDGVIGGSQTPEEGLPGASGIVWTPPSYSGWPMNPIGSSSSVVSALDAGDAFGAIQTPYPGPTNHAAIFPNGSAANWIDLHPLGMAASGISAADEGQQVGGTGYYSDAKAGLWFGSAASHRSLHPAGAERSGAYACQLGIQAGYATVGGLEHAVLWAGSAESVVDLHGFLPSNFTASSIEDVEVHADGSMVAVGAAYNADAGRWEAMLWTSGSDQLLGDLDGDGAVSGADLGILLGAWGTADRAADLNSDGAVDGADLAILLGAWM